MEKVGPLIQYVWYLYKKENLNTDTCTGRTMCRMKAGTVVKHHQPRDARNYQSQERGGNRLPVRPRRTSLTAGSYSSLRNYETH